MSSSSSAANRDELDSLRRDTIQAELSNWQQILFYGNMDGSQQSGDKRSDQTVRPNASSSSSLNEDRTTANAHQMPTPYFAGSLGPPPQVPPETYNYLIHALLSLQGSASHPHPQYPPGIYPHGTQPGVQLQAGPSSYGWPVPPSGNHPLSGPPIAGSPSIFSSNAPVTINHGSVPQSQAGPSHLPVPPVTVPSNVPQEEDADQSEDGISVTEDKRRRNTAASARFRIKKKQKTLNLERTVSDLTGRTEELEREAADLRRENGWLKEIVLLKGRSLGAFGAGSSQPTGSAASGSQEEKESNSEESETEAPKRRSRKGKDRQS
ncbi:hypothetical protein HYDPIDRAFT_106870 [Hydnomerulius pinastri MD-312]|nr:hypothetical protein HYDPIDRAFT_106870 [Hydnomerulius pinastri MD-312]